MNIKRSPKIKKYKIVIAFQKIKYIFLNYPLQKNDQKICIGFTIVVLKIVIL